MEASPLENSQVFIFSFGVFATYFNGQTADNEDNTSTLTCTFDKANQVWNFCVDEHSKMNKMEFSMKMDNTLSIDTEEKTISWRLTGPEYNNNYFFFIMNDFDGSYTNSFKDAFEKAFDIPVSYQLYSVKDEIQKSHLDEREQYRYSYRFFIPSFIDNKVIGFRNYIATVLCFDEQTENFNCGNIILESCDEKIISGILVNFEDELVYCTENNNTILTLYSFKHKKRLANIEFGFPIHYLTNIKQQLCTDRCFYVLYYDNSDAPKDGKIDDSKFRVGMVQIYEEKVDNRINYALLKLNSEANPPFELRSERGPYINISSDKFGLILCVSELGYVVVCSDSPVKGVKDFKKFKVKIKTKDIVGADFYSDPWSGVKGIIFSGEVGLKYISWKSENDRKNSKIETIIKKSEFSVGKNDNFTMPCYIPGKVGEWCPYHKNLFDNRSNQDLGPLNQETISSMFDKNSDVNCTCTHEASIAICCISNKIVKWKDSSLQHKSFNDYKVYNYVCFEE